jgi:hypothetical protein
MIWLLPHLFPPSLSPITQVVSLSQSSCVLPVMLTDGKEGVGRSPIRRRRESLVRYIYHSILSASFLFLFHPHFTISTITYKVVVYTIQLRGHTHPPPFSNLYLYTLWREHCSDCTLYTPRSDNVST